MARLKLQMSALAIASGSKPDGSVMEQGDATANEALSRNGFCRIYRVAQPNALKYGCIEGFGINARQTRDRRCWDIDHTDSWMESTLNCADHG